MNYSKFITFDVLLVSLIVIIATGLLVWNRMHVEPHMSAVNIETGVFIERGEIMATTDEFAAFEISDSKIYLSNNTEVKLVDGREGQIDLQLIQGRIILEGNSAISIREVDIATEGKVGIVHYSWLDEIEVVAIDKTATITWANQTLELDGESILMQTLDPFKIEYIGFDPEESSESEFYNWIFSY